MTKNLFVRFGHLYEKFEPEKIEPVKIVVPDDSLIYRCYKSCVYKGKHADAFHYILISKSMSKKQAEKLDKSEYNICAITKLRLDETNYDYVKFNGYSAILFNDCLISEHPANVDNIIGMNIYEEKLNKLLFEKPVYVAYINSAYRIDKVVRFEYIKGPDSVTCHTCSNYDNLISKEITTIDTIKSEMIGRCNNQTYCKELFDEIMYNILTGIYDGFKQYKNKYELNWLHDNLKQVKVPIFITSNGQETETETYQLVPIVDCWDDVFKFKKRLPKN